MAKDYGGQAVIEGVMMKASDKLAIAVRLPNGKIKVKKEKLRKKKRWLNLPLIRGVANLIEILVIGIKSLFWSADQQLEKHEKITKKEVALTLLTTILITILFFIGLPYILTLFAGFKEETQPILFNFIDGIIKLVLFLAYVLAISMMSDVRMIFQYHGAEHKTIYCNEAGKKLTVQNAKKFSTKHPRCGTSFLVIVLVISIIVFSLLPSLVGMIYSGFSQLSFFIQKAILLSSRIIFIPVIAGISYELLKLSAKFQKNIFIRLLTLPGILVQYITTKEPDEKQIEVAIEALKAVK